jgi:hypothetical protein
MLMRTMISVLALGLALAAPVAKAARTFCCDDHGKRVCGDVLPQVCASKAYSEFNERGIRGPNHGAPLTAAEEAQQDAELKKKRATEKLAVDQLRADQALLATYATEADLDNMRDRKVADAERSIKQSQDKLDQALKENAKLAADLAANKGQDVPQDSKEQLARYGIEIKTQQDAIAAKRLEVESIKARVEADRKRLRELRGVSQSADSGAAAKP